jgi:hypothetical protein
VPPPTIVISRTSLSNFNTPNYSKKLKAAFVYVLKNNRDL